MDNSEANKTSQVKKLSEMTYSEMVAANDDWASIFFIAFKEFCAVFSFLICLSRLGPHSDLAYGSITFVMLILYGACNMPFLNPYLYFTFRLGPLFDMKQVKINGTHMRIIGGTLIMIMAQLAGGLGAGGTRKYFNDKYGIEKLRYGSGSADLYLEAPKSFWPPGTMFVNPPGSSQGTVNMFDSLTSLASIPMKNVTGISSQSTQTTLLNLAPNCSLAAPHPYNLNDACGMYGSDRFSLTAVWWIFEEMFAVFGLCIGMIVIVFGNIYDETWSVETTVTKLWRKDNEQISMYLWIALLHMGIAMAFPTADLGMHVTVYKWISSGDTSLQNEPGFRVLGGVLGAIMALAWFMFATQVVVMGAKDKTMQDFTLLRTVTNRHHLLGRRFYTRA